MIHRIPDFTKLKNGIRLLTFPLNGTETVTALVLVKVGSRNEEERIGGISHFLEHLLFKGTKKRPSPMSVAMDIERVGGYFNAFTSKEYTGFFITSAATHLELVLDILSDILTNSLLDEKEIERERGVILEEMRLSFDTPLERIGEIFETLLYGAQPLGRDVIGTLKSVKEISRQDVTDYMNTHYRGDNTVVVLSGKISSKDEEKIKTYFEIFQNGHAQNPQKVQEEQHKPSLLIEEKNTDQAHLALGFRAFPLTDERKEALDILATILGAGKSSRMFQEVREKLGLAYYVNTDSNYYTDSGYIVTLAGVNLDKIDLSLQTILKEYYRMTKELVTDEELSHVKEHLKGRLLIELESSFHMAQVVGAKELLLEKRESFTDYFKRLSAVSASDIQKIAKELFHPKHLNLSIIGPFSSKKDFLSLLNDSF